MKQIDRQPKDSHFFLFFFLLFLVAVSIILLRLWIQLNHGVDTHNSNAGFHSTLELLDLAHARFQDTGLEAVVNASLGQVKTIVPVGLLLGNGLLFLVGITLLYTL